MNEGFCVTGKTSLNMAESIRELHMDVIRTYMTEKQLKRVNDTAPNS